MPVSCIFPHDYVSYVCCRKGSIIAEFQLTFRTKVTAKEAMVPLRREIADGKMGSLDVDPSYLKQTVSETRELFGSF